MIKFKIIKIDNSSRQYILRIFNLCLFCLSKSNGFYWFRLFGIGLKFKDITKHNLLFSERNGFKKHLKINNWIIGYLKFNNI